MKSDDKYAWKSLVAITLTIFVTAIHHIYRLGIELILPSLILIAIPYVFIVWHEKSKDKKILWGYGIYNSLIFLWFGLIDGFFDHVFKALGLQNSTFLAGGEEEIVKTVFSIGSTYISNLIYEGTGIMEFVISVIAIYYCYKYLVTELKEYKN